MIQAKWIPGNEDLSECMALQRAVFVDEQRFLQDERDWIDEFALHVLVYDDAKPVATGRMYGADKGVVKIGRICVAAARRGNKLGDLVLRMLLFQARGLGAEWVWVTAQAQAQGFYERFGFLPEGEPYKESGILQQEMKLAVKEIKLSCEECKDCGGR
ncbi:MAG: GNAT family N-acetyltransferase [Christensenellales bacterium]